MHKNTHLGTEEHLRTCIRIATDNGYFSEMKLPLGSFSNNIASKNVHWSPLSVFVHKYPYNYEFLSSSSMWLIPVIETILNEHFDAYVKYLERPDMFRFANNVFAKNEKDVFGKGTFKFVFSIAPVEGRVYIVIRTHRQDVNPYAGGFVSSKMLDARPDGVSFPFEIYYNIDVLMVYAKNYRELPKHKQLLSPEFYIWIEK